MHPYVVFVGRKKLFEGTLIVCCVTTVEVYLVRTDSQFYDVVF